MARSKELDVSALLDGPELNVDPIDLPDGRVCIGCRSQRTNDEFQHAPDDPRCVYCVKSDLAQGKELDREALCRKMIGELLDATDTPVNSSMPRPSEIGGALIEEFGGVRNFVHQWHENVRTMARERPGSFGTVKAYNDIGKFILQASRQEDQRDIAEMSSEELVRHRNASIANVLKELSFDEHRAAIAKMLIAATGADMESIMPAIRDADVGEEPPPPDEAIQ